MFDFAEFAADFPITVMCSLIGASPDRMPQLRNSLEALGSSFSLDPKLLPRLERAVSELEEFLEDVALSWPARACRALPYC